MGKEDYLFVANVVFWVGIGCYVAFLAVAQRRLAQRLKRLEVVRDD